MASLLITLNTLLNNQCFEMERNIGDYYWALQGEDWEIIQLNDIRETDSGQYQDVPTITTYNVWYRHGDDNIWVDSDFDFIYPIPVIRKLLKDK